MSYLSSVPRLPRPLLVAMEREESGGDPLTPAQEAYVQRFIRRNTVKMRRLRPADVIPERPTLPHWEETDE